MQLFQIHESQVDYNLLFHCLFSGKNVYILQTVATMTLLFLNPIFSNKPHSAFGTIAIYFLLRKQS